MVGREGSDSCASIAGSICNRRNRGSGGGGDEGDCDQKISD